jgi:hypothetical protein
VSLRNVWDRGGIAIHGDPKAHFEFASPFLLPFITYLVGLYLTAALVDWNRFVRALALCGVSVAATFMAVPVALIFAVVLDVQQRKDPGAKPNHAMHADSAPPFRNLHACGLLSQSTCEVS